jgi:GH18 family chitinase
VVRDPTGKNGPYAYKGKSWVSFDDVDQIAEKTQYIKDMGLGGGMIWALDLDDFRLVPRLNRSLPVCGHIFTVSCKHILISGTVVAVKPTHC